MFVLGCKNVIVIINHKSLIKVFNHMDIGTIENPKIKNCETNILQCQFTIKHCPGKWKLHDGALSRFLTVSSIF